MVLLPGREGSAYAEVVPYRSAVGLAELLEGPALVLSCLLELGVLLYQPVKFVSKDLIAVQDLSGLLHVLFL